jgi:class 3 adenylate cyclase/tetratricopeptide (TPR) repeat protein
VNGPSEAGRGKIPTSLVRVTPLFIDRRPQLDLLEHCLEEAVAGRPRVVLIQGDAGTGKTRLLKEVRPLAERHGLEVCYGRCYEDVMLPYLPFAESLFAQLVHMPEEVKQTLSTDAELIRLFLERAGTVSTTAGPVRSAESDQDTLRLFLALTRATIALAQHRPTVLILDDLHWADRSSLDLLSHLVFAVADAAVRERIPLLIVGAHRPVEPEDHLARVIARFQREEIYQSLQLSGLESGEVDELIQGLGVTRPSHQLVTTVSEATKGNPLFVQEVVHHLVARGALEERGGYMVTTASPSDLRLPVQVTLAIAARIQELSERCRRVLTLASFLGDYFSLQTLQAVSELSEDDLLDLLEEGVRQRLLLAEGQPFQFAHPLIRHVLYSEPLDVRRQRIHLQIARTLEHLYANNLDTHILEIAHHLVSAGSAAEAAKVVEYARRAGDHAYALFAWGEAARYYEAALAAAEPAGILSAQQRGELHYLAGYARYRDMDAGPSLDHYEKAISAYRLSGDIQGLALALKEKVGAHFTLASVPYGTLIDVQPLEELLSALGDTEPGLGGRLWAKMAQAYWHARRPGKAEEMALKALEIGQHSNDDPLCAEAYVALALVQSQSLRLQEALDSWQNSLAAARRENDRWRQGWSLQRMPLTLTVLGQLDEAEAMALKACELIRETHDWGGYSVALASVVFVAVAKGNFAAAEKHAHEAMMMVRRSHYPWGGAQALFALASARFLRGAWTEAEDAIDILVEPGRVFAEAGPALRAGTQVYRQLLRAYSGAGDEVRKYFTESPLRGSREGRADIDSLAGFCALVEIADQVALPPLAEQLYHPLSRAAERGALFSRGWMFLIPRVLGVAAAVNRWWDQAETHFQTAIATADQLGARPELGRSYLDYACMLSARNQGSDRAYAMELIQQAIPIFVELRMEPFVTKVTRLAQELQAAVPQALRQITTTPENLSEREIAIVDRMSQGRTNPEIADELILSSQTVGQYVRDVTGKIRVICFTDMKGSTENIVRWGDAKAHELLRTHDAIIRACLTKHNGSEIKRTGDGFLITFASASDAIACTQAIQRAFAAYNQAHPDTPLTVRIGLNAGEPIADEADVFGGAVHAAARICAYAQPEQILVSEVVRQLVAGKGFAFTDCGAVPLKGFVDVFHLFAVQWEEEGA